MEPAQRIPLIKRCANTLAGQGWAEIDFLLGQFNLPTTNEWSGSGPSTEYGYVLAMLGDRNVTGQDLIALDDYLHDRPTHDVDDEPWSGSACRIFLSHLWGRRTDAVDLQAGLTGWGIQSIVAHRDIEPAAEWQQVILAALHSCHALVALLHTGYGDSDWCDQEAGVAIGRRIPVIPIRVDITPYGLLGAYQALPWPSSVENPGQSLATALVDLLIKDKRTGERVVEALVERLVTARSFDEAGDVASKLVRSDVALSSDQLDRIRDARQSNDQVGNSRRAAGSLNMLLSQPPVPPAPVIESYGPEEAPF